MEVEQLHRDDTIQDPCVVAHREMDVVLNAALQDQGYRAGNQRG